MRKRDVFQKYPEVWRFAAFSYKLAEYSFIGIVIVGVIAGREGMPLIVVGFGFVVVFSLVALVTDYRTHKNNYE